MKLLLELEHDIKDKLEKWVIDGYEEETPTQYSKDAILELVDRLIVRLQAREDVG